jgi:adenylate cyclase
MDLERRISAVLAADVVGYSRLTEQNEADTVERLRAHRTELFEPEVARHRGRIFKLTGDGFLAEFASVVEAVECAVALQLEMAARNQGAAADRRIDLRVAVNLGDVIIDGEDRLGEGVNIAARLEALADPGGVVISGTAFDQVRNKTPHRFEELGPQALRNMTEPVRAYRLAGTTLLPGAGTIAGAGASSKASIAVLPFTNMSGDPEQTYFSDGVTEDIITELSRFRSLFVIARHSSFALRDEPIGIVAIARRLDVQYVVEGSVRRVGDRVRITAQLIDAASGTHLWAERFDRDLADIFAVQDEVVRTVAATVAGRLEVAGAELARRKPPESLVAYDYVLRGLEQLNLEGKDHNAEARRHLEKAIELDPHYAAGHAYLALAIYVQWTSDRAPGALDQALVIARRALALDENDSRCHRALGHIYAHLHQFDRAEFHATRSIALNPNDALAALGLAVVLRYLGRSEEAIEWARKAMQLNPYHPNWYWGSLARLLHTAGRYADALDAYSRVAERPSFHHAYVAACHAELGQVDQARAHAALAREAKPDFSVAAWGKSIPFKNEADLQRFLDGLRKAGLPE